jgi:hypothetical protein
MLNKENQMKKSNESPFSNLLNQSKRNNYDK